MMSGRSTTAGQHQMMANHQAMMTALAAEDRTLTELLARMNAAKGDDKVAAIAAVVTELAARRSTMQQMMRMQGAMMEEMMAHMSRMQGSEMMKKAPAPATAAPEPDHSTHHPGK